MSNDFANVMKADVLRRSRPVRSCERTERGPTVYRQLPVASFERIRGE